MIKRKLVNMVASRSLVALVAVVLSAHSVAAVSKNMEDAQLVAVPPPSQSGSASSPRFVESTVMESCSVYISGASPVTRSGTCKHTSICASENKESVPGHCSGGTENQCCVAPIECVAKPSPSGWRAPGWCTEPSNCKTGNHQSSSYGADGCNQLKGSVKCCVGAGAGANDDDNEREDGHDDEDETERSDRLFGYNKWIWNKLRQMWEESQNSDGYARADAVPTCPASRQLTAACKENYGNSAGCDVKREPYSTCPTNCRVNIKKITFGETDIRWVCDSEKTGPTRGYTQSSASDPTRGTPPAITRATILDRAVRWINERVRYSQRRMHGNRAYRTDCTGFVSMAFDLPQWGTTSFVRGALNRGSAEKTIERVACKGMLPGDSLVSEGHIVLFRRWIEHSTCKMEWWEARGTAWGAVKGEFEFDNCGSMSNTATDGQVKGRGKFWCLKRKEIVA